MGGYYKSKKKYRGADAINLYSPKGKEIAVINMPQFFAKPIARPMTGYDAGSLDNMALMWYFISWSDKLTGLSEPMRIRYAREISKLSELVPIHLINFVQQKDVVSNAIAEGNLKLFKYQDRQFVMLDEKGTVVSIMTPARLYALFAYLMDSLAPGLENHIGFEFVKMAKHLMANEEARVSKVMEKMDNEGTKL